MLESRFLCLHNNKSAAYCSTFIQRVKKVTAPFLFWSEATLNFQNPRTCALNFVRDPRKRARNRGYQSRFLPELALYLGGLGSPGKAVKVL